MCQELGLLLRILVDQQHDLLIRLRLVLNLSLGLGSVCLLLFVVELQLLSVYQEASVVFLLLQAVDVLFDLADVVVLHVVPVMRELLPQLFDLLLVTGNLHGKEIVDFLLGELFHEVVVVFKVAQLP